MNLLSWNPSDPVWLTITVILGLLVIYYLVCWSRSSKRFSDSSDDYAKSYLEVISFGCIVPLGLMMIFMLVIVL